MARRIVLGFASLAGLCAAGFAAMSFASPASQTSFGAPQVAIADLAPTDGVRVCGVVTSVFGNAFVLRGAGADILVETGPRWWRRHTFQAGENLCAIGERDDDDFDARRIDFVDGRTLEIRASEGPPPWAGRGRD
jgi:hypothetical protein